MLNHGHQQADKSEDAVYHTRKSRVVAMSAGIAKPSHGILSSRLRRKSAMALVSTEANRFVLSAFQPSTVHPATNFVGLQLDLFGFLKMVLR